MLQYSITFFRKQNDTWLKAVGLNVKEQYQLKVIEKTRQFKIKKLQTFEQNLQIFNT